MKTKVAAVQMSCLGKREENIEKAEYYIRKSGAGLILLPELFEREYFCQQRNYNFYSYAETVGDNMAVKRFTELSRELSAVIPVSFYEKDGNNLYNSLAMLDSGRLIGVYRKTHIPDDHFYQEKFYFTPGNTGFKVFATSVGKVGVGICWDQWFPEAARCMALLGADILLYPTAIGSEPILSVDSMPRWRRVMQGHAAANVLPVIAANRVGVEEVNPCGDNAYQSSSLKFYGSSFMTDRTGEVVSSLDREEEGVITAEYDFEEDYRERMEWGVFRDRRPERYGLICE